MPAIDAIPPTSGGGAVEQRRAGSSSGGGGQPPAQLNSAGFNGYTWTPVTPQPKKADNSNMDHRITKLESFADKIGERLVSVEKDIAVIKSNYATKEDVQSVRTAVSDAKGSIILWVVSAIILAQVVPQIPALFKAFLP